MNVYDRLSNLFAYMCNQNFPATVHNIAKAMNVYEKQIAQDIAFIESFEMPKGNPLFKPHMSITYIDGEPCYHMNPAAFVYYSHLELDEQRYSSKIPKDYVLCPLTHLEDEFHKYLIENEGLHNCTNNEEYKEFSLQLIPNLMNSKEDISDTKATVEEAMTLGKQIEFNYQGISNLHMIPHLLMRDINTKKLYAIETFEDDYLEIFSLAEMDSVRTTSTQKTTIIPKKIARAQCIWSFEPEYLDKIMVSAPTHIKVKIYEDNADIINKIKADTCCRSKGILKGPFPSQDDSSINIYFYEDDVIGLEAFEEWTRQFGSSVIMLEPKELAYDIYRALISGIREN